MKITAGLLILICIVQLNVKSQDIIREKNGDSLICKIIKVDSANIYFEFYKNKQHLNSYLPIEKVLSYETINTINNKNIEMSSRKNDFLFLAFDPLGLVTMGPDICGEFLVQAKSSSVGFGFYTGIRITNLGLASNLVISGGSLKMSYSIPLAARIYTKARNKSDGFFIGPHVEFGRSNFTDNRQNKIRAFGGELGYKWVKSNGFSIELSDVIGVLQTRDQIPSFGFYGDETYTYEGSEWKNLAFVAYMISLKIGYTFH
jgi:hypothetical protein